MAFYELCRFLYCQTGGKSWTEVVMASFYFQNFLEELKKITEILTITGLWADYDI
jgi:hypothetical protein